jgi:hypothetical protein
MSLARGNGSSCFGSNSAGARAPAGNGEEDAVAMACSQARGQAPQRATAADLGRGMFPQAALAPHCPPPITGPHQRHPGEDLPPRPPSGSSVGWPAKPLDTLWFHSVNCLSRPKNVPRQGAGNFSLPIFPSSPAAAARAPNAQPQPGRPHRRPNDTRTARSGEGDAQENPARRLRAAPERGRLPRLPRQPAARLGLPPNHGQALEMERPRRARPRAAAELPEPGRVRPPSSGAVRAASSPAPGEQRPVRPRPAPQLSRRLRQPR